MLVIVGVKDGVLVGVRDGVDVGSGVAVGVGVATIGSPGGVGVANGGGVGVGVDVGVLVASALGVGVAVGVDVGVAVGAHNCPPIRIASDALTIDADEIFPAKLAITDPVFTTVLRSSAIGSVPLQRAWTSNATPETCGAAIEVPLM